MMENKIDFSPINMTDIPTEVRELAVAWAEANKYDWIGDKVKLASDIQNYSDWYANQQTASLKSRIAELEKQL